MNNLDFTLPQHDDFGPEASPAFLLSELNASWTKKQLLETLFASSPVGMVILDRDMRYISVNPALAAINGCKPEEHLGLTPGQISEVLKNQIEPLLRRVLETGRPVVNVELNREAPDNPGQLRHLQASYYPLHSPDGATVGIIGLVNDVTALTNARTELEQRVRRQAALAALGQVALTQIDQAEFINRAAALAAETLKIDYCLVLETLPGQSDLTLRGSFGRAFADSNARAWIAAPALYSLKTGEPLVAADLAAETRFEVAAAVREHGLSSSLHVIIAGETGAYGALGVYSRRQRDFSQDDIYFLQSVANVLGAAFQRRRAEESLRRSEQLYRSLARNFPNGLVLLFDRNLRYLVAEGQDNPLLLGLPIDQLVGKTIWEGLQPELAGSVEPLYRAVLEGTPSAGEIELNGQHFMVERVPVRDEQGRVVAGLVVSQNITERKRAEAELSKVQEQLRHSQKMEAIGRLAGGIAHDFNNILTGIQGYTELALLKVSETDPLQSDLKEIFHGAERAATLTRQLLAFSRRQVLQPRLLNLNEVVERMEKLLLRLIGEDIELVTRRDPHEGLVKADPGQLEQVIMNLAVNARDAMPRGGQLSIIIESRATTDELAREVPGVKPGPYMRLTVSDTGHGMEPETLAQVFEPFFTTKEVGKGTGLGLATVYGIIKQSDGYITVASRPGQGTTFKIYLPQARRSRSTTDLSGWSAALSPGGPETVLVVEDEEAVRQLTCKILEMQGYRVLQATRPEEARTICQDFDDFIDLLLTDIVMPTMNGTELAGLLGQLRPEMRVLYTSGYTDGMLEDRWSPGQGRHFLQKPFTPNALLQKVREALG